MPGQREGDGSARGRTRLRNESPKIGSERDGDLRRVADAGRGDTWRHHIFGARGERRDIQTAQKRALRARTPAARSVQAHTPSPIDAGPGEARELGGAPWRGDAFVGVAVVWIKTCSRIVQRAARADGATFALGVELALAHNPRASL